MITKAQEKTRQCQLCGGQGPCNPWKPSADLTPVALCSRCWVKAAQESECIRAADKLGAVVSNYFLYQRGAVPEDAVKAALKEYEHARGFDKPGWIA